MSSSVVGKTNVMARSLFSFIAVWQEESHNERNYISIYLCRIHSKIHRHTGWSKI